MFRPLRLPGSDYCDDDDVSSIASSCLSSLASYLAMSQECQHESPDL